MSGKHAMPSAWRPSRVGPVVVAAVALVVWVAIAATLLLSPEPPTARIQGSDGPAGEPYTSEDESTDRYGSSSDAADPSPSGTPSGTAPRAVPRPEEAPSPDRSPAQPRPVSTPSSSAGPGEATREPTQAARTQSAPADSDRRPGDNPGRKKGHDKPHGPRDKH